MKTSIRKTVRAVAKLGKEIKISPKAVVHINSPGYKVEYFEETVEVVIGVGKDNVGSLILTKTAWEELNNGAEIIITKDIE